uniref:hypothetical protein n=1 Tax=Campylobacter rectus TaxID=203 RepID=UPI001C130509|nr:hypothetical protein [Campylobacter rectus]
MILDNSDSLIALSNASILNWFSDFGSRDIFEYSFMAISKNFIFLGIFKIHKISAILDFNLQSVISSKILSKNSKSCSVKSSNIADLLLPQMYPASYGSFKLPGFKAIE